jgi:hypothetical protein
MDFITKLLDLVKVRLGIAGEVAVTDFDAILIALIRACLSDLEDLKIDIDENNNFLIYYIVDYVVYFYNDTDEKGSVPKHLRYRLQRLLLWG